MDALIDLTTCIRSETSLSFTNERLSDRAAAIVVAGTADIDGLTSSWHWFCDIELVSIQVSSHDLNVNIKLM